ncbi:MAG: hypothetical protein KIS92_10035 [Planctomycetota bacterium]|nr:hypothetical protein [Planctomycetota bacterium]
MPALFLFLLIPGCAAPPEPPAPRVESAERSGDRVTLALNRGIDAARLELLGPGGQNVEQRWTFTSGERRQLTLSPAPDPGACEARLVETGGRIWTLRFEVPEPAAGGLRARMELPFGAVPRGVSSTASASREVWLPVEALSTFALTIDAEAGAPERVEVTLAFPPAIVANNNQALANGWSMEIAGGAFSFIRSLPLRPGDRKQFLFHVQPLEEAAGTRAVVRLRIEAKDAPALTRETAVRCVRAKELAQSVRVTGADVPADRNGAPDVSKRPGVLQLPTHLGQKLRAALGMAAPKLEREEPFSYQSVRVRNETDAAMALEVSCQMRDLRTGGPAVGFDLPVVLGLPGASPSNTLLVPARGERSVALPLYVDDEALPGEYVRHVETRLIGSDAVVSTADFPLGIEQTDRPPLYFTLLAALITALALPVLLLRARRIMRGFTNTELVQIALFGAASFVLVNVPSQLASTLISALLPVLNPFVLGLWDTLAASAIEGAVVALVPRPGVVLLAGGVRFLLNGILFGAFSPVSFLMTVPSLLVFEALLWICGCTRGHKPSAWAWGLAFGLNGIVAAGLNLALAMALYRLFYADWYIALYLVTNGFTYHAAGGAMGARLGLSLQRTAE